MKPQRWPDEVYEKRTEPSLVEGVWHAANACRVCGKWIPPWKAGVPVEFVDAYCWVNHNPHDNDATFPQNDAILGES